MKRKQLPERRSFSESPKAFGGWFFESKMSKMSHTVVKRMAILRIKDAKDVSDICQKDGQLKGAQLNEELSEFW